MQFATIILIIIIFFTRGKRLHQPNLAWLCKGHKIRIVVRNEDLLRYLRANFCPFSYYNIIHASKYCIWLNIFGNWRIINASISTLRLFLYLCLNWQLYTVSPFCFVYYIYLQSNLEGIYNFILMDVLLKIWIVTYVYRSVNKKTYLLGIHILHWHSLMVKAELLNNSLPFDIFHHYLDSYSSNALFIYLFLAPK